MPIFKNLLPLRPFKSKRSRPSIKPWMLIAAMVAFFSGTASANLLEYSFNGADGSQHKRAASEAYANPTGTITFALSAGLERVVRISILDSDGKIVSTRSSHLLGAQDRITVDGKEYYGSFLDLSSPGEGQFTLRSEIISAEGEVVRSDEHKVLFDTTAPQIHNLNMSDILSHQRTGVTGDGISDADSGVDRAIFYTIDSLGVRREIPASYNDETGIATVIVTQVVSDTLTPYDEVDYEMGFGVYDRAGNYSENRRVITVDKTTPTVQGIEVYDHSEEVWKPYVKDMLVYENPVKLRIVLLKKDHIDFNGSKLGWRFAYHDQDDEHIYYEELRAFPNGSYRTLSTTAGHSNHSFSRYTFTYAPGVGEAPKPAGIHHKMAGEEWVLSGTTRRSYPYTIEKVRINFQERPYTQVAKLNAGGLKTCTAPAGATSCEVDVNLSITEGRDYSAYSYSVSSEDGKLTGGGGHFLNYYDFNKPEVLSVNIDHEKGIASAIVFDGDRVASSYRTYWQTTKFELVAIIDGVEHRVPSSLSEEVDYQNYYAEFPLKGLPSGAQTIRVEATDTYGHVGTLTLDGSVLLDNIKPVVQIQTTGGDELSSLDDITIKLRDESDPEPTLTSILLEGGPATEKVQLSWRKVSNDTFRLEYPIMFPSLEEGEEYKLTVTGRDWQNNISSASHTFVYSPPSISIVSDLDGKVRIPAMTHVFTRKDGTPALYSPPFTLSDGTPVSGSYEVFATLRSDAPGPMVIGNKTVSPGETATLNQMNFSETGGRIILPVAPAINGQEGESSIIISTSAPNTPIVLANLVTWLPRTTLVTSEKHPVQVMSEQAVSVHVGGSSFCKVTTSSQHARNSDLFKAPVCLLEWTNIPRGLKQVAVDGTDLPMTMLKGRYLASGEQAASYNVYVYDSNGSRQLVYQEAEAVEVAAIERSGSFEHSMVAKPAMRAVEHIDLSLVQTGSAPACEMTTNNALALKNATDGGPLTCLIEFSNVPVGLKLTNATPPKLEGIVMTAGEHPFGWVASVYDEEGNKLVLEEKESVVKVVEPPVTSTLKFSVNESASAQIKPTENYPKAWASKSYSVITEAEQGVVNATADGFSYTPNPGYVGPDSFVYRVTDSSGMFAEATAEVTVAKFNYPPTIQPVTFSAPRNVSSSLELTAEDPNLWDSHTFEIASPPKPAGIKVSVKDGVLNINPVDHWYGTAEFSYRARDSEGLRSEVETITVVIEMGEDATAPAVSFTDPSSCVAPGKVPGYQFLIEDYDAGVDADTLTVKARFSDGVMDVPLRLVNTSQVRSDLDLQVAPRQYQLETNIAAGSALDNRLRAAYYEIESAGGRLPFDFTLSVSDMAGNQTDQVLSVEPLQIDDSQAPTLAIKVGDDESLMRHIYDLTIVATDDLSGIHSQEIVATLASGSASMPLVFSQAYSESGLSKNSCYARHPLRVEYRSQQSSIADEEVLAMLVQAYADGEELTLTVEVSDYAGNATTKELAFTFVPDAHETEVVTVPAVQHQFRDDAGGPTLTIKSEDMVVAYDPAVRYMAIAASDNDVPVAINGQSLLPGQPIELGTFSLLENQKFSVDLRSDKTGAAGDAAVLLIPLNPTARSVRIPVKAWAPEIRLDAKNWNPVQLFDPVSITAKQVDPAACQLTTNQMRAQDSDKMRGPLCLLTWEVLPSNTFGLAYDPPEVSGYIPTPGEHNVEWSVALYDDDGSKHVMAQGAQGFSVRSAADSLVLGVGRGLDDTYRIVSDVLGELKQESGPRCSIITTSSELAHDMSMRNQPACLVAWEELPNGIEAEVWTDTPKFSGSFAIEEGDARFAWSLASFSTSGERVEIMSSEQVVALKDPPSPSITMAPSKLIAGSLYQAPMNGGVVGDYTVEAINANVLVAVKEDGELVDSDEAIGGYSQRLVYRGRILANERALWSRTPVEIDARYTGLPEVNTQKAIEVLAVPDDSIRPSIEVSNTEVLNTEAMIVESQIGYAYQDSPYDIQRMGEWEVRLLNHMSTSNQVPLTEYVPINGEGKATFDLDLLALNTNFMRIMPQARLISPIPEFTRTTLGARPLHVTILRGEAIKSRIEARKVKGEAPLNFMGKLDLSDRLDYKSLGDITWEMKENGSSAWVPGESQAKSSDRLQYVFEPGLYEVRARVLNKHSGAEFTTEEIEIHAYNVPRIAIDGPANAFIGSEATLNLSATVSGKEVPADELLIEWSEDNGETWVLGSAAYTLSRSEEERVMLMTRVRMANSPDDWADAFSTRRHRVAFRLVSPPRGSIHGSRVVEEGNPVQWEGTSRAPYPRMDVSIKGRFIMPDGRVIEESDVEYLPTRADSDAGRIEVSYESWVEGFEDQGAISTVTRRISVWQYKWPDWKMIVRSSSDQAPAEVNLRVSKPVGIGRHLEDVKYEWELPEGVELTVARTSDSRVLQVAKPGIYPVTVRISDSRGNFTEVVEEVEIKEAEPWAVDFRMSMSNKDARAPLDVRLSPAIRGGHPRDRVNVYRYMVNGNIVSEGARYSSVELNEGRHELALEIESDFGDIVRNEKVIEVQKNTPPVCELEAQESRSHWRFFANCTDETGKVRRHMWVLNGEPLALSGSRISVSSRESAVIEVQLSAIDDGGAESNVVTWHGSAVGTDEE